MFRARIVFNAPLQREHTFYSVSMGTREGIDQMLADLRPALVHAVSVQVQESTTSGGRSVQRDGWRTVSPLGLVD